MIVNTLWGVEEHKSKICIHCKEEKIFDNFYKHPTSQDGFEHSCKTCRLVDRNVQRKLLKSAPPKPKVCECCNKPSDKFVIDHDHDTLEFRGWICHSCNTGIGILGDNLKGIMYAVRYLKKYETQDARS